MILENTLTIRERRNGSKRCGIYPCKVKDIQREKINSYFITFKCDVCGKEEEINYNKCFTQVSRMSGKCANCYKREIHKSVYGVPNGVSQGLRNSIRQWRKDSLKHYNYKCMVTGEPSTVIHHIVSYSKIVAEAFKELNIDPVKMDDTEYKSICDKVLELHYKYGFGACLSKEVHKAFHDKYGELNNTEEQFKEFINSFKSS